MNLSNLPFERVFTEQYKRRAARFLEPHPDLRQHYLKTLQLLEANPSHSALRRHPFHGEFEALHSVLIKLSYRITLELLIKDQQVIPVNVGDHEAAY